MAFRDLRGKAKHQGEADASFALDADAPKTTYLDRGCELMGKLSFQETVRIDGSVDGEISAAKTVIVGETGRISAEIEAESVEIFGHVEGDIHARRKITLHKTASVTGEIHTAGIVVEEGASFKGCIVIGSQEAPRPGVAVTPAAPASSESSPEPDDAETR